MGEVTLWGGEEPPKKLGELQNTRSQAHQTHIVEGVDPVWTRGFRLKVEDRHTELLRIQILHKGYMATEFIGEVLLEVAELIEMFDSEVGSSRPLHLLCICCPRICCPSPIYGTKR